MTNEEAQKIQRIARSIAIKWHRPELAEDFAQEAVIQQLRWPGIDLEYAFINLLRKEHGSSRTPGGRARQAGTRTAIHLDAPVSDQEQDGTHFHELVGDPRPDPRTLEPARDFSCLFEGKQAQIYRLRYEEDLSLVEIAKIMGTGHPNICEQLMRMNRRIMLEVGLDQVKETLEDDPGITRLEIDWIKL